MIEVGTTAKTVNFGPRATSIYRVTIKDLATGRVLRSTFRVTSENSQLKADRIGFKTNDSVVLVGADGTAYLSSRQLTLSVNDIPSHRLSQSLAKITGDYDLVATCQTQGQRITNGDDDEPKSRPLTYSSRIWYGVEVNGTRGYIADTWTTRTNGLGLPQCGRTAPENPAIDAAGIINPKIEDIK